MKKRLVIFGVALTTVLTVFILTPTPARAAGSCQGITATITGTSGADTINGTSGNDIIDAQGGADYVDGKGGDDRICGDDGNDELHGGAGVDHLWGGTGNDLLYPERGDAGYHQTVFGNSGDDTLSGLVSGTSAAYGILNFTGGPGDDHFNHMDDAPGGFVVGNVWDGDGFDYSDNNNNNPQDYWYQCADGNPNDMANWNGIVSASDPVNC